MDYYAVRTIISGNRVHRPLMHRTPTAEDLEKAFVELNEIPQTKAECMEAFIEMLREETDFIPRIDEDYLLPFLRVKKFNLEEAYKCLRNHYQFRAQYPEIFPAPRQVQRALEANIFNYLPHRDHMGRAIFIIKMANWNVNRISFDDFVAAGYLVSEYVLDNPVTQINGYIGIWDFRGFSWEHMVNFTFTRNIPLLLNLIQDCFPGRLKFAICLHCNLPSRILWRVIKYMLKEKYRNRVHVMGNNIHELHQFVDPSILPVEFGGKRPPSSGDEIAKLVLQD